MDKEFWAGLDHRTLAQGSHVGKATRPLLVWVLSEPTRELTCLAGYYKGQVRNTNHFCKPAFFPCWSVRGILLVSVGPNSSVQCLVNGFPYSGSFHSAPRAPPRAAGSSVWTPRLPAQGETAGGGSPGRCAWSLTASGHVTVTHFP